MVRPVLGQLPEGLGVFFVLSDGVGTDEGVDKGEAVGFPDEFDVGRGVVGDMGAVFIFVILRERSSRLKNL